MAIESASPPTDAIRCLLASVEQEIEHLGVSGDDLLRSTKVAFAGLLRDCVAGESAEAGIKKVCNLYAMIAGQAAIREIVEAMTDLAGNMPGYPGIFPDYRAPIVRNKEGRRELVLARWGMPSPAIALRGRNADIGVTNVRNTASKHWSRWLGPEHRCLVPFTSFSENEARPDGTKPPAWFAFSDERPLAFFAGIWTNWTSVRKVKEGETNNDLYAFLTTDPNREVGAIHPKAMPVILTRKDELETWLTAPTEEALKLQRPLPDGSLRIVARGSKRDPNEVAA